MNSKYETIKEIKLLSIAAAAFAFIFVCAVIGIIVDCAANAYEKIKEKSKNGKWK